MSQEGWTYIEGFYFSFVTLTTIGFGDLVAGEQRIICLLLGLSFPSHPTDF